MFYLHMRAAEQLQGSTGANATINVGRVTQEGSSQQEISPQQPPETISMEISFNSAHAKILEIEHLTNCSDFSLMRSPVNISKDALW